MQRGACIGGPVEAAVPSTVEGDSGKTPMQVCMVMGSEST
jgi:hypothetical protein